MITVKLGTAHEFCVMEMNVPSVGELFCAWNGLEGGWYLEKLPGCFPSFFVNSEKGVYLDAKFVRVLTRKTKNKVRPKDISQQEL